MWVAKTRFSGEKGSLGKRTKKFNVSVSGYPVSSYETKKGIYVYLVGFIFGKETRKREFLREWKKDKKVLHIETHGDFVIAQILEPLELKPLYSHKLINIKPIIIDEKGVDYWTIGGWNKKDLVKFIKAVEKNYKAELVSIEQQKIKDFSIIHTAPKLTKKQKLALELAIKNGYYNYPRKISIEGLAKITGLSFSTFHAHLRKAEQKLIPFFFSE